MKLFYWSNSNLKSNNANVVNVLAMCKAFSKALPVQLFHFSDQKISNEADSVHPNEFLHSNLGRYSAFNLCFKFLQFLLTAKFNFQKDIVYTRSIYIFFLSAVFNLKVYYEIHNIPRLTLHRFRFFLGNTNKRSFLIFITYELCEELKTRGNRYRVLPSGADILLSDEEVQTKRNYMISEFNPLSICYVGSDHPGKGIDRVFQMAKELPEYNFQIVGEINSYYDWPSNCHLFGRLNNVEARIIMSKCHLFLLPNHDSVKIFGKIDIGSYTSPLKLFEYFSSYGCVFSSDLKVLREIVTKDNAVLINNNRFVEEIKITGG